MFVDSIKWQKVQESLLKELQYKHLFKDKVNKREDSHFKRFQNEITFV